MWLVGTLEDSRSTALSLDARMKTRSIALIMVVHTSFIINTMPTYAEKYEPNQPIHSTNDTRAEVNGLDGTWELISIYENGRINEAALIIGSFVTFVNGNYTAWTLKSAPTQGQYMTFRDGLLQQLDMTDRGSMKKAIFTIEGNILRIFTFKTSDERPSSTEFTQDIVVQTFTRKTAASNMSLQMDASKTPRH